MTCPDQEILEALEEEGPFQLEAATRAHIRGCPACQRELAQLRRDRRAFSTRGTPPALPSFEALPFLKVPALRAPMAARGSAPHTWTAGLATLAAAAAALLLHVPVPHRAVAARSPAEVGALACFPPEDSACTSSLLSSMASAEPSWAACLTSSPESDLKCEAAQALVCEAESPL